MANTKITADNITDGAITSAKLDTNIAVGGTLNVSGAFTSLGIDDNADATAITIDSDENILIGTDTLDAWYTSTNGGVNILGSANFIAAARSGGTPFIANRLSSDGGIMEFKKDGTAVGSIACKSGSMYIGSNLTPSFIKFSTNTLQPCTSVGGDSDNTLTLGDSNNRFKDLYLSGGAYIGGTGAANKLDDYEEGTWTPIPGGGGSAWTVNSATYTKIGNMVTCRFHVTATATVTAADFTGLPFTPAAISAGVCGYQNSEASITFGIMVETNGAWNFRHGSTKKGLVDTKQAMGTFNYRTTA